MTNGVTDQDHLDSEALVPSSSNTLLAHEWIASAGGSENVFEQMRIAFPGADAVCLWNDDPGRFSGSITESWLAKTPLRKSKPLALAFMPHAWSQFDLDKYERVLASSHAFCHHLAGRAAAADKPAFVYVHTPARYIWSPSLDPRGSSIAARALGPALRRMDRHRIRPGVEYAANSRFVASRVRAAWGVEAQVIHPSVDVERIRQTLSHKGPCEAPADEAAIESLPQTFILGASRFVEYKRLEEAIRVGETLNLPVVLAGRGPDESRLRRIAAQAKVPVRFVLSPSDHLLIHLFNLASLFVFMPVEDFGIMPIEAIAAGTPVLVNSEGGAIEGVRKLAGGFDLRTHSTPKETRSAATQAMNLDMSEPALNSIDFSAENFRRRLHRWTTG